jgi:hypothetical protein
VVNTEDGLKAVLGGEARDNRLATSRLFSLKGSGGIASNLEASAARVAAAAAPKHSERLLARLCWHSQQPPLM